MDFTSFDIFCNIFRELNLDIKINLNKGNKAK